MSDNRSTTKVTVKCSNCGSDVIRYKKLIEKQKYCFCSRNCKYEFYSKNKSTITPRKKSTMIQCSQCGTMFEKWNCYIKERNFCSRECHNKWVSLNLVGEKRYNYTKKKVKCSFCRKEYLIQNYFVIRDKHHFCTRECKRNYMALFKSGKNHARYIDGRSYGDYCEKFNFEFKRRVRAFFDNKCVICGKNQDENNGRRMCVHHVTYDKNVCCNDTPIYFVTLCSSCHTKTNYNKEYYNNLFVELINTKYNGKCYYTKEEFYGIKL